MINETFHALDGTERLIVIVDMNLIIPALLQGSLHTQRGVYPGVLHLIRRIYE